MSSDEMSFMEKQNRASKWWDTTGRKMVKRAATTEVVNEKRRLGGSGPMIKIAGDIEHSLPQSGILMGNPWDQLTIREQMRVIEVWHNEHILVPEQGAKSLADD